MTLVRCTLSALLVLAAEIGGPRAEVAVGETATGYRLPPVVLQVLQEKTLPLTREDALLVFGFRVGLAALCGRDVQIDDFPGQPEQEQSTRISEGIRNAGSFLDAKGGCQSQAGESVWQRLSTWTYPK